MIVAVAIAALGVLSGCKPKEQVAVKSSKVLVTTSVAEKATIDRTIEFTGNIEPFVQNNIAPSMAVRIEKVLVDVGDKVRKGQLLVVMDDTEYGKLAVQLAQAEIDCARLKNVYEAGGIAKKDLDEAVTQLEVLRKATKNLYDNIELRSPIDGVITARYYDPGDLFSMSPKGGSSVAAILTVMQMTKLKVMVGVSEQYFREIKLGMPVDINVDLFPDKHFDGKVSLIYPSISTQTRTFTVEVSIPNASLTLRPGMFSRTSINLGKKTGIMVEDLAVQKQIGTNEKYVYIVKDGKAERHTVTVGTQVGKKVDILSGVNDGDEVVISGVSKLSDGVEVESTNK